MQRLSGTDDVLRADDTDRDLAGVAIEEAPFGLGLGLPVYRNRPMRIGLPGRRRSGAVTAGIAEGNSVLCARICAFTVNSPRAQRNERNPSPECGIASDHGATDVHPVVSIALVH